MSLKELSEKYNFKEGTISIHFNKRGFNFSKAKKFTDDELSNIILDYQNGMRPYELEDKYKRDSATIIGKLKDVGVYKNSLHHFSDEEIEFLKKYYPIGDWDSIFKFMPNVSRESIHAKMSKLGIKSSYCRWKEEDIVILKEKYESMYGEIKQFIDLFDGRYSYSAICSKAEKLGLKSRQYWSDEEIEILKNNYSFKPLDEVVLLLPNRNRHGIIAKAIALNLKNYCKYKDYEIKYIFDNWTVMSDKEMATNLSKSLTGLINKRCSLGLLRTKEHSCYKNIYDFLRKNNSFWKEESMKHCKYRCVLTNNRFDDIHHIYSFNLIISEVIEALNLDLTKSIDDFSKEELQQILEFFRHIQNKYPLGVCLSKDIHILFHNLYGYGNTTVFEWNEFVFNYKNNKYNHLINVA